MEVSVENVWTYFDKGAVVPFNFVKFCSFWLSQDRYIQDRRPNIIIPPKSVYQPSRKRFLTGIIPLLRKKGFRFKLRDRRNIPELEIREAPHFMREDKRYEFQLDALDRAIRCTRGIIKFVVGGGKTYFAAGMAYRLRCNHLIIVPKKIIFKQFAEFFNEHFSEPIGLLGSGLKKNLNARIVVASNMSLARNHDKLDFSRFQSVIVDEAHHIGWGSALSKNLRKIDAFFRFGLSGTPIRPGGDHLVTIGLLGPVIFDFDYEQGVERDVITPVKVFMFRFSPGVGCFAAFKKANFDEVYGELVVRNATRNSLLSEIVRYCCSLGKTVLVLVQRKLHGRIFLKHLESIGARLVFGNTPGRNQIEEEFRRGKIPCLIAIDSMFGEGANVHHIDVVVCAGGFKSPIATIQRVGRALRRKQGKKTAVVIDVFDETNKILRKQALLRRRFYRREGYEVIELESNGYERIKEVWN